MDDQYELKPDAAEASTSTPARPRGGGVEVGQGRRFSAKKSNRRLEAACTING